MPLKRVNKLGQVLLDEGLVTETDLRRALESQDKDNKRLGEVLMDMGILSPKAMLSALAKQLNVKAVQLRHGLIDPAVARLLDREEAARLKALPLFKVGDTLTVAMAEPQALPTIDRLGALTGCRINPVLALESNIAEFQEKYLGEQVDIDSFLVTLTESEVKVVERETIDEDTSHEISRMVDGSPIINLVNLAIMTAVRDGASDIHVEPTKQATRLRYRIDGNLRELMSAPNSMHAAIVSRIKVIGKMDIAERRLPQEGRVHVVAEGREIDLRVSSMPTLLGEKIVLRILDKSNLNVALDKLGVSADQLPRFRRIFSKPHGIVLVTGPTGSGKTTTLYSVIDLLSSPERNIVTIEDPVEYQLDGINQVQVNEAVQMTFARALRSLLRQDPDVIMVGEIRDTDTARVAIQAALTGHLVLTTLHTNDTVSAVARLRDLGVPSFLIAATLTGVVAQRLVRQVCPACAVDVPLTADEVAALGVPHPEDHAGRLLARRGQGCNKCRLTGYYGRSGIFEVLGVNSRLRHLIAEGATPEVLHRTARQDGLRGLRDHAVRKVAAGVTSFEEAMRATADAEGT